MTTKYKLIAEDVWLETNEDGQSAEARIVEHASGSINTLPAIGDAFAYLGTTASSCRLRRIRKSYLEADSARLQYHLSYSTPNNSKGGGGAAAMTEREDRRWNISGEMITVPRPVGWTWKTHTTKIDADCPIGRRVFLMSWAMPTKDMTNDENESFKVLMRDCAGMINGKVFDGIDIGNVLFDGAEGGSYRDELGTLMFRYNLNFSARIIPGKQTYGWCYVMRPDGVWDIPMYNGTMAYGTADLNTLFIA